MGHECFCAGRLLFQAVNGGLGRLEMCPKRGFGGLAQGDLSLCVGVFFLQVLDVVGLPEGLGAEGAEGRGEGFAVLGIALCGLVTGHGGTRNNWEICSHPAAKSGR